MAFDYACFISYRHGLGDEMDIFVNDLKHSLENKLKPLLGDEEGKVYIDREGLSVGDYFDIKLAQALCKSMFMILVFTPVYFHREKNYCTREYAAMRKFAQKRLENLPQEQPVTFDFILPVVFRAPNKVPSGLSKTNYIDCSALTSIEPKITKTKEGKAKISELANTIYNHYDEMLRYTDFCQLCENCELPSEQEIQDWLDKFVPNNRPRMPRL